MPRFKHYNYDQDTMVVINYQEQLQPGTFEHAVHYLIEQSWTCLYSIQNIATTTPADWPTILPFC